MNRTPDPDFDLRIADWLEADPDSAPAGLMRTVEGALPSVPQQRAIRLPWRRPAMNRFLAIAAAAVVLLLTGLGLFNAGTRMPATQPALEPSGAPSHTSVEVPLARRYFSVRHGYRIRYPDGWAVTPATAAWVPGTRTLWGDPALDVLESADSRLVAASQPLLPGQTADAWYRAYCEGDGSSHDACTDLEAAWRSMRIGGHAGYVTLDGVPALPGTIRRGGPIFDAVVVGDGRAYEFTLDGAVDRALFNGLLASVSFTASGALPLDDVTATFSSPLYGYSIEVDPRWTVEPATALADAPAAPEHRTSDQIRPSATDTTIGVRVNALGARTFDAWLTDVHQEVLRDVSVPDGCKGGGPALWPEQAVGDRTGREMRLCNFKQAFVEVEGRVYTFTWANDTFSGSHFPVADFDELLRTVAFPQERASSSP